MERIEDLSGEQFDATFKTNVYAMFWITKAAMPHLGPGAAIINTASVEAYAPEPHLLDYASTKACIVAFTKSLAKQVAKRGIRVNAVAPGPYWTALQVTGGQLPEKQVAFGQNTPLGRPGQPAELGPVYVLLASGEASDTTGQVYGCLGCSAQCGRCARTIRKIMDEALEGAAAACSSSACGGCPQHPRP